MVNRRYFRTKLFSASQRDYLNLLVKYGLEEPSQLAGIPLDDTAPTPLGLGGFDL